MFSNHDCKMKQRSILAQMHLKQHATVHVPYLEQIKDKKFCYTYEVVNSFHCFSKQGCFLIGFGFYLVLLIACFVLFEICVDNLIMP